MANKIEIKNFLRMSPQIPEYNSRNQNFLIANADPLHYLSDNTQEEQVAPLIASRQFSALTPITAGHNVVDMIGGGNSVYDIFIVDDTYTVYGYDSTGTYHSNFSNPESPSSGRVGGARLAIFGDNIIFSSPSKLFVKPISSGSWTEITPALGSSNVKQLEPFLEYIIMNATGEIYALDSSLTAPTLKFDLGTNAYVTKLQNFNDKYIAIAYNFGNTIGNNYIAMWDGISSEPNYRVKVPGLFQDMTVDNSGSLKVMALENSGQSALYYLVGTNLRREQSIQYDYCDAPNMLFAPINVFFKFRGTTGVRLHSKGNLLIGNSDAGAVEYIINDTVFTKLINAGTGHLFAGVGKNIYYLPETGTSYANITYTSQWIPVKNLAGIDVWYDAPPVSGTDAITLTVYGQGENLITSGTQTINCPPITPTAFDTQKRTRVELRDISSGEEFAGDQVKIVLTTVNTGTWRPKINAINLITS